MEFAILKALLFVASLLDGVYLGVLAHELGHAIVALALTANHNLISILQELESLLSKLVSAYPYTSLYRAI